MSPCLWQRVAFGLIFVGTVASVSRRRQRVPFLANNTILLSQNIQPESNSETLIEKLLINGDVISAETLWKAEMESQSQLHTSDSKNTFVSNPVNFKTAESYIVTRLELTGTFSIYFQVKTTKFDGLIMYAGPLTHDRPDFMAVELVAGIVRFVFDVGTGIRVIRSNPKQGISDNEWHDVGILRPTLTQHILRVDDSARPDPLPDDAGNYDLTDEFYIGGLPQDLFKSLPKQVKSRHGFYGCLGSIDLNGESQNLMEDGTAVILDGNVVSGCEDPNIECSVTSCGNGGTCIQHWDTLTCNCELTSFTGPSCDDDAVAYTFGEGGGLIRYNYTEGPVLNAGQIRLAFGIHTHVSNAVLMYFESHTSHDFIQMELNNGNIVIVHHIGNKDHILKGNHVINDGVYHTVRFLRSDNNSTLQVDGNPLVHRFYTDSDGLFGGGSMTIYIGSQAYPKNGLVKPFYGSLAGMVINGVYVLDQIADGEERVSYIGNVVMELRPLRNFQSLATALPHTTQTAVYHMTQYTDSNLLSEGPKWQVFTTLSENHAFPFFNQLPIHLSTAIPESHVKSTSVYDSNRFGASKKQGHQTRLARPLTSQVATARPKSGRTRHMKQPYDLSDDLIVTRATKDCPPAVDLDCPGLPTQDADALLYPATRLSKHRKPNRSGPPTIHPFNTAFHKENSGSKPCIPDDDEDCDISSGNGIGNGPGLVIKPLPSTKSAVTDDIIYVYKTEPIVKEQEDRHSALLSSTTTLVKISQSETITLKFTNESSTTTAEKSVLPSSEGENEKQEMIRTLPAQQYFTRTPADGGQVNELTINGKRESDSVYLEKLTMNIGLIIGIAIGIALLLLVLAFALYKYRSRSELSCNGNDTKGYVYETCNTLPPTPLSTGPVKTVLSAAAQPQISVTAAEKPKRRDVKEWYV